MEDQMMEHQRSKGFSYAAIACGFIAMMMQLFYVYVYNGKVNTGSLIIKQIEDYGTLPLVFFMFLTPVMLFFVFSILFSRKKQLLLLIPLISNFLLTSILVLGSIFDFNKPLFHGYIFQFITHVLLIVLFTLTVHGTIKSKWPLISYSVGVFVISSILFLALLPPFGYSDYDFIQGKNLYLISDYILYITWFVGYTFIALSALENAKTEGTPKDSQTGVSYKQMNIGLCIVLSIVTLGIYALVWLHSIIKHSIMLNNENEQSEKEFLLCVFVPFYILYWVCKNGKRLSSAGELRGINIDDNSVIYVLCTLFGLPIIAFALMQNDLNRLMDNSYQPEFAVKSQSKTQSRSSENDNRIFIDLLKELSQLKDQGIITEEEFNAKKSEILAKM